jgi:Fic family protein
MWYNLRKGCGDFFVRYIYQHKDWPKFRWSSAELSVEPRLKTILDKAAFWEAHSSDELTANQRAMLNRLFDGFKGNLTSSKWAKICKVSQDTASREINALVAKGILRREGQGRSTHYVLA